MCHSSRDVCLQINRLSVEPVCLDLVCLLALCVTLLCCLMSRRLSYVVPRLKSLGSSQLVYILCFRHSDILYPGQIVVLRSRKHL